MNNLLKLKGFCALVCLLGLTTVCAAQDRAALGPIEAFTPASATVILLGQSFQIDAATRIAANGRPIPLIQGLRRLTAGQHIYVEGVPEGNLVVARSIELVSQPYVAGATTVSVLAAVSAVHAETGTASLGGLIVDITTVSPVVADALSPGAVVLVSGIQPSPGGLLLAPSTFRVIAAASQSVGGSGLQSVGGSGVQSVGGSGIQSVGGSGRRGGGGVGVQSVGGSGRRIVESVGGSGRAMARDKASVGGSGSQ